MGDEFCSRWCLECHYGLAPPPLTPYQKRRLREARDRPPIAVENTEAMNYRVPGSFGSGKRR